MGVWERSPAGIAIANRNPGLLDDFRGRCPIFGPQTTSGRPTACGATWSTNTWGAGRAWPPPARSSPGGGSGSSSISSPTTWRPTTRGSSSTPTYFVQGNADDAVERPGVVRRGRRQGVRLRPRPLLPRLAGRAAAQCLQSRSAPGGDRRPCRTSPASATACAATWRCCCMNQIFERTWGERAGQRPAAEYWPEVIPAVKNAHPDFLFMAEAYWDLEWELQQQGFDYCYDKRLYDRLEHDSAENVRLHLCADLAYQEKLVRFIENHDEPRAAAAFPGERRGLPRSPPDPARRKAPARGPVRGPARPAAGVFRAPARRDAGREAAGVLSPPPRGRGRGHAQSGRVAALRVQRLAGQLELAPPRGLVLVPGGGALPRRGEPFGRSGAGPAPSPLGSGRQRRHHPERRFFGLHAARARGPRRSSPASLSTCPRGGTTCSHWVRRGTRHDRRGKIRRDRNP